MSLRDHFAAQAMAALIASTRFLGLKSCAAEAYQMVDAMLAERIRDRQPSEVVEIMDALCAYFPQAETAHDCFRAIEALERDAIRYRTWRQGATQEPMKFAKALATCNTPEQIDKALDQIAGKED